MKFVSLDVETTGLDPEKCQILEIGAVVGDFDEVSFAPQCKPFHCYVLHEQIVGEPFALAMNADVLRTIATRQGYDKQNPDKLFLEPWQVPEALSSWLLRVGFKHNEKVTFAGKNFAGFDLQFLRRLKGWSHYVTPHHRSLDVGSIYFDPTNDQAVPSLQQCMERAGMEGKVTHRATEDAQVVVDLLRFRLAKKH